MVSPAWSGVIARGNGGPGLRLDSDGGRQNRETSEPYKAKMAMETSRERRERVVVKLSLIRSCKLVLESDDDHCSSHLGGLELLCGPLDAGCCCYSKRNILTCWSVYD